MLAEAPEHCVAADNGHEGECGVHRANGGQFKHCDHRFK
jgi:hypothetical protein